jgi:hypothetical protein
MANDYKENLAWFLDRASEFAFIGHFNSSGTFPPTDQSVGHIWIRAQIGPDLYVVGYAVEVDLMSSACEKGWPPDFSADTTPKIDYMAITKEIVGR